MVARQKEYSSPEIQEGYRQFIEEEALPTFDQTLSDPTLDARRKDLTSFSRYKMQLELAIIKYTIGYDIEDVRNEAAKVLIFLNDHLQVQRDGLDVDIDQYILVVWTLALANIFNLDVSVIEQDIPHLGQDLLVDRLYYAFDQSITPSLNILFPALFGPLCKALGVYKKEEITDLVKQFLDGYFNGLKKYDAAWLNSHKEADPDYYTHFGYWSFELAALVLIVEWDDGEFRNHPLYPNDLIDWKRSLRTD